MTGLGLRLGDLIDDYCPRCRLLLNHAIASMVDGKVVKVICQTCLSEHPFLHGEGGKKKKPRNKRAALFDEVLARGAPPAEPAATPAQKKKRAGPAARYISRHKVKPPEKKK